MNLVFFLNVKFFVTIKKHNVFLFLTIDLFMRLWVQEHFDPSITSTLGSDVL